MKKTQNKYGTVRKNKAYKFRLYPTKDQEQFFANSFGCVRFVYNYYLDKRIRAYKDNKHFLSLYDTINDCCKNLKDEFSWLKKVDARAINYSLISLNSAYTNFFKNKSNFAFPKFKSKHNDVNSYTTDNFHNSIKLVGNSLIIPKIKVGIKVKVHREIPPYQVIKRCTISKTKTGKYYASILVEWYEEEVQTNLDLNKSIGLDYSSSHFYVDSQNIKANYPKFYRINQEKLSKENRKLAKCVKGSNNYYKQKKRVALIHEHIANQRKDWLEKLSCQIANDKDIICIESLNMRAMSQCLKLGKSTMDNSWGMFIEMLKRKAKCVVKVDKWFPSSKLCPVCGCINRELKLKDRTWVCDCGNVIDRDFNAANNILQEGLRILVNS